MPQHPNGIHHIAIMAVDIKQHIAFFSDVLGFPLVALFDMHGVPGGLHAFLRMNDHGYFSIVQLREEQRGMIGGALAQVATQERAKREALGGLDLIRG